MPGALLRDRTHNEVRTIGGSFAVIWHDLATMVGGGCVPRYTAHSSLLLTLLALGTWKCRRHREEMAERLGLRSINTRPLSAVPTVTCHPTSLTIDNTKFLLPPVMKELRYRK